MAGFEQIGCRRYPRGTSVFAIKNEPIDLLVLERIFLRRRTTESQLCENVAYRTRDTPHMVPIRMPDRQAFEGFRFRQSCECQFVGSRELFRFCRHCLHEAQGKNNLLGTEEFCPIVRRTQTLEQFVGNKLSERAQVIFSKVSSVLIARAASFLLLADAKAGFAIDKK